jgi:hypothetical protein
MGLIAARTSSVNTSDKMTAEGEMGRSALSGAMANHAGDLRDGARIYITASGPVSPRGVELADVAIDSVELLSALIANGEACKNWLAGDQANLDRVKATIARMIRDAQTLSDVMQGVRRESNSER